MEKQWDTRKSSLMCGTDGQNLQMQVKLRLADKMKQTTESEAQQQDKGVR